MLDNYKDIITEIELSKIRVEGLEEEDENLRKVMFSSSPAGVKSINYNGMPGGSRNDTTLDVLWERLRRIQNAISIEKDRIDILSNTKIKMDNKLNELEGLEYKIAYMQLQGKTLKEIAEKLNYNESYIRQVAARINKERN